MSSITALIRLKQRRAPNIINKQEENNDEDESIYCNIRSLTLDTNSNFIQDNNLIYNVTQDVCNNIISQDILERNKK